MRRLQIKFPSQIRISGWDFGSSARAMNQAGGKDALMTYENESIPQAELRKGLNSTTERKSMSTKTTIKRIALVAVSALGLGVVTTVAPASAAGFGSTAGSGKTVSVSAAVSGGQAVRLNIESTIKVTFTGPAITAYSNETGTASAGGYANGESVNPSVILLAKPATSTMAITPASAGNAASGTKASVATYSVNTAATANYTATLSKSFTITPDVVGTYTFNVFDDTDYSGTLNGATEKYTTFSVTVTDAIASLTATTVIDNASTKGTTYGGVVKVCAKDANGNPTVPSTAENVKVSATGAATFTKSFVAGSQTLANGANTATAYLTYADFDSNGCAYLAVVDATAQTVTITPSVIGALTTPTATSASVKFVTPTSYIASEAATADSTTKDVGSNGTDDYYTANGTASLDLTSAGALATDISAVNIIEEGGKAFGNANIIGTTTVTGGTAGVTELDIALGTSTPGYAFYLTFAASATADPSTSTTNAVKVVSAGLKATSSTVTVTPSSATAVAGSTQTFQVTVKDQYASAVAGVAVTAGISGRNSALVLTSQLTNAKGVATFSYTDASTSTTLLSDTVTFTYTDPISGAIQPTATVTYVTGLTVSKVTVTASDTTKSVANPNGSTPTDIDAGKGGATGSLATIKAYVTSSQGALAGIPVTFSVAGTGAAIPSNEVTAYTDSTGMATSHAYAWIAGSYTITATALGVSGTGINTFRQNGAAEARSISATVDGGKVVATLKDRFGNPVVDSNAKVYAKITSGSGYFANSSIYTSLTGTDPSGSVTFVVAGGSATVVVSTIDPNGNGAVSDQTTAAAGYVAGGVTTPVAFTAYVAGTTATAEVGVGASYSAAGVSSVTVDVAPASSSDSVDAANEATDAANAATDAANAAAEAADAATAAAQDAQAAVAALATQVASLIAGIKAQITTLTNLVIKIQKKVRA